MIVNADFHIHSPYSKPTQHPVSLKQLSTNASIKGLDILGTGDCLHPQWLNQIKTLEQIDEGTFCFDQTIFLLTVEIETNDGIHHLLFFPSISCIHDFIERTSSFSPNIDEKGRPHLDISSEHLAFLAKSTDALIGPAHLFDANKGLYSKYPTLSSCYKQMTPYIAFAELGLGTNTYHADKIGELHHLTYLTNSDTHNPHPIRLGRQFTQFQITDLTFSEIKKAILRNQGKKSVLNVGFPPEEGKYFSSACTHCHKRYTVSDAEQKNWICHCGYPIKKGVTDIIQEKATYPTPQHPYHRPLYLSFLPLHEIITRTLREQNPFTKTVSKHYNNLISTFGNEITILLQTPIEDISRISPPSISESIQAFRYAIVYFNPGGGGTYGSVSIPWEKDKITISLRN